MTRASRSLPVLAILAHLTIGGCGRSESPESAPPDRVEAAAGAAEPAPFRPFNGRDLGGWKADEFSADQTHWQVGAATIDPADPTKLTIAPDGGDLAQPGMASRNIFTEQSFADHRIELEVMLPRGSNSGIYVMGEYEVQVADRDGSDPNAADRMDHGAIAGLAAPMALVPVEPGRWQRFSIDFRAPRFDEQGRKAANARFVRIEIDGRLVHENVEVEQTSLGGLTVEEHPQGPLYLQGNEGPVAYRHIVITPLD